MVQQNVPESHATIGHFMQVHTPKKEHSKKKIFWLGGFIKWDTEDETYDCEKPVSVNGTQFCARWTTRESSATEAEEGSCDCNQVNGKTGISQFFQCFFRIFQTLQSSHQQS